MNALIVDDDRFVLIALEKGINWKDLGIEKVYSANRIEGAKKIIENNQIDILLSDIDMPQGSGIDLLEYLRNNGCNIPTIFLTNYADFNYAQKALELKSFHYYLKPIDYDELSTIIAHALEESTSNATKNKTALTQLWLDYILQNSLDSNTFTKRLVELNQANTPYTQYSIGLYQLYPYMLDENKQLICQYNSINEIAEQIHKIFDSILGVSYSKLGVFTPLRIDNYLIISVIPIKAEECEISNIKLIKTKAEEIIYTVKEKLSVHSTFLLTKESPIDDLPGVFTRLLQFRKCNVNNVDKVLMLSHYDIETGETVSLDTDVLASTIKSNDLDQFKQVVFNAISRNKANGTLSSTTLANLKLEVDQLFFSYFKEKALGFSNILSNESFQLLSRNISLSDYYFKLYIEYITSNITSLLESNRDEQNVKNLLAYVDAHFKEEINRTQLAEMFYFDPDYITKIFKKEKGLNYKDYIIEKRLELAKKLLLETDTPVRDISISVGYDNYSYFTRLFKKNFGMTPQEFRKEQ